MHDLEVRLRHAEAARMKLSREKEALREEYAVLREKVERMLKVCESLRAQGRNILDFLEKSIMAGLCGQPHPSLLPGLARS